MAYHLEYGSEATLSNLANDLVNQGGVFFLDLASSLKYVSELTEWAQSLVHLLRLENDGANRHVRESLNEA